MNARGGSPMRRFKEKTGMGPVGVSSRRTGGSSSVKQPASSANGAGAAAPPPIRQRRFFERRGDEIICENPGRRGLAVDADGRVGRAGRRRGGGGGDQRPWRS